MLKNERERQILTYLQNKGYATVKELSQLLFASESSIRRDLTDLESMGNIRRSYGGAEIINTATNVLPFGTRAYDSISEKRVIASKAAELIKEGDIIFLDSSSTGYFLAMEIMDRTDITVVTNSVEILGLLSVGKAAVHSTGGTLSRDNRICLIGRNAEKGFEEIYADKAFFSAKAVSEDGVISDCTQEEVFVRNSMLKNAGEKVFLCNFAKIGKKSAFIQCSLRDVDIMICERDVSGQFGKFCKTV